MTKEEVFKRVRDVLQDQWNVTPDMVTPEARFTADLGGDSIDCLELIMALEEEFGIDIPDEVAEHWKLVDDATSYITTEKQ